MIESDVENSGWEIDVGDLALVRDNDRVKLQLHIKAGAMTGENNWPCLLEETIAHCEEKLRTPKISTGYGALV